MREERRRRERRERLGRRRSRLTFKNLFTQTKKNKTSGKLCIEVSASSKLAWISEELCIGCGICVKKCPFDAIMIINLPKNLERECTHRYGPNSFKLHRLPVPRPGQVLGLVGTNGIGKSTALKVLGGKLKPNLGRFENPPDWQEVCFFSFFFLFLTFSFSSSLRSFFSLAVKKPRAFDTQPLLLYLPFSLFLSRGCLLPFHQKELSLLLPTLDPFLFAAT